MGSASACGWWLLWANHVAPALSLHPGHQQALTWATYAAGAAFAVKNLLPMIDGSVRAKM